jgi:hypothetical protein
MLWFSKFTNYIAMAAINKQSSIHMTNDILCIFGYKGTCNCKASACDLIVFLAGPALSKSIKIAR